MKFFIYVHAYAYTHLICIFSGMITFHRIHSHARHHMRSLTDHENWCWCSIVFGGFQIARFHDVPLKNIFDHPTTIGNVWRTRMRIQVLGGIMVGSYGVTGIGFVWFVPSCGRQTQSQTDVNVSEGLLGCAFGNFNFHRCAISPCLTLLISTAHRNVFIF